MRKGEIAREMYVISDGIAEVLRYSIVLTLQLELTKISNKVTFKNHVIVDGGIWEGVFEDSVLILQCRGLAESSFCNF